MSVTPISLLETRFTKVEALTVVQVGEADMFGRARAVLSDGSHAFVSSPVIGMVVSTRRRPAIVLPLEHEDGWRVQPWNEDAFNVRAGDLAAAIGRSQYVRRAT